MITTRHKALDDLPSYASNSLGQPDLTSIANRLKEMAVLLADQGLVEPAEHIARACGSLLASLAVTGIQK